MGDASTAQWVTALPCIPLRPFIDRYVGYRMERFELGIAWLPLAGSPRRLQGDLWSFGTYSGEAK
ncbi:MAG TPA: hypothetical protein VK923_17890 [Euzebyales bacterium]|nr:hypothetical protein [Euzebyales bacterium]